MRARFKTEQELLASGWNWEAGWLKTRSFSDNIIPPDMLSALVGQFFDPNSPNRLVSGRWQVTPAMLMAVRVRADATRYADMNGIRALRYRDVAGQYIPADDFVRCVCGMGEVHFESQYGTFTRDMLEPSPTVEMLFDAPASFFGMAISPSAPRATTTANPNPAVVSFRDADATAARGMITCGFELETHLTDGRTYSTGRADDPIDEERAERALQDQIRAVTKLNAEIMAAWKDKPKWLVAGRYGNDNSMLYAALNHIGLTVPLLVDHGVMPADFYDKYAKDAETRVRNSFSKERYRLDAPAATRRAGKLPETIEIGADSTVRGFEFRTIGGLTYEEFEQAATALFSLPHEVDNNCSFHIHLAVNGVKHKHSDKLQMALTEYLIENVDRAPAGVRERWKNVRDNKYIQPGVRQEKYSFVWRHEQGTWEFRCFGRVDNLADAMTCLQLAIEAMQYGYKVITDQAKLITEAAEPPFDGNWRELCLATLERGESITTILGRRRKRKDQAAA